MKFKQKMIGVNKVKEKNENASWTKISLADEGFVILKQFDGITLDTIALTKEEVNEICKFVDKEVA
tara:strand:- start:1062 stop:1259 length:198 start_codon:yes stop_codon:yes gene_type:complete